MSNDIPNLINIKNTLTSVTIQQIRSDLVNWENTVNNFNNNPNIYVDIDWAKIQDYLNRLNDSLSKFKHDNVLLAQVIENDKINQNIDTTLSNNMGGAANNLMNPNIPNYNDADKNLYDGLIAMYTDYIHQLSNLLSKRQFFAPISKEVTTTVNDSQNDNINNTVNNNSSNSNAYTENQSNNGNQNMDQHNNDNAAILNEISNNLQVLNGLDKDINNAKVRKQFITKLIKNTAAMKLLKLLDMESKDKILTILINFCQLDEFVSDNIMIYLKFLKLMGFTKDILQKRLPSSITRPKVKLAAPSTNNNTTNIDKSSVKKESTRKKPANKDTEVTKERSRTSKINKKKMDIYIADSSNKKEKLAITDSNSSNTNNSNATDINKNIQAIEVPDDKKKISFTKYLKKDDSDATVNGDNNSIVINKKRPYDSIVSNSSEMGNKDTDIDNSNTNSETDEYNTEFDIKRMKIDKLPSILKNGQFNNNKLGRNLSSGIKFVSDSKLVKVYGDDLPMNGLSVTPLELKKVLRPFVEGEPNERLFFEDASNIKLKLLNLENVSQINDNDISEIKGGKISLDTMVPHMYRSNFNNFNKDLKNRIPKEPILLNNNDFDKDDKPIIMKAFGQNRFLLKKDRGGLPYKHVPEVLKNRYPIKYSR